jgi:hypothetical protein
MSQQMPLAAYTSPQALQSSTLLKHCTLCHYATCRLQVHDQTLERGNRALLANIALGLPVRVFRRNDDRGGATNSVLFYDGLYDVVSTGLVFVHCCCCC